MKLLLIFILPLSLWAIDHTTWSQILKRNTVLKESQVYLNYKQIKRDRFILRQYLGELDRVKYIDFTKMDTKQQLAYLINLYNAQTVSLIVDHYPIESIKKIGGFFRSPWKRKFFKLFGKKVHLDYLEHKIIRQRYKEPRIHFALNCASMGCPSLLEEAFLPGKLNEQLDRVTRRFLNNKRKNYLKMNRLYLSKIFDWYEEDFGDIKLFISKYNPRFKGDFEIEFLRYDWNLNSVGE